MKEITHYEKACVAIAQKFYKEYLADDEYNFDEGMDCVRDDVTGVWTNRDDTYWDVQLMYQALNLKPTREQLHEWYWERIEAKDGFPNLENWLKMS